MPDPSQRFADSLLARRGLTLVSIRKLQSLWAGYGSICAVTARADTDEDAATINKLLYSSSLQAKTGDDIPLILKFISKGEGGESDEGHWRKMLSYEIERRFYEKLAPQLSDDVRVARCLEATTKEESAEGGVIAMLLADLRVEFPVAGGKREALQAQQVYAALDWLGNFHRTSKGWRAEDDLKRFVLPPLEEQRRRSKGKGGDEVWLNGGYTYLATRRKEYAGLKDDTDSEWSSAFCEMQPSLGCSIAEAVAEVLTPRGRLCESYIHGDVKSENLFTNHKGDRAAFFDFQYVGLGLGVCDLAKLFTCSVPMSMLGDDSEEAIPMSEEEQDLLQRYRQTLGVEEPSDEYPEDEFRRHWECALVDWCRFQASWGFWGNTEWLEGRVRWILQDEGWQEWLRDELRVSK